MRRTPLKPKRKPRMSVGEREKAAAFKLAYAGRICKWCGWQEAEVSHHVVYEQALDPPDKWRLENAMPLCHFCHRVHHDGSERVVPASQLSDANVQFAKEVLGPSWWDYLSARYGSSIDQTIKRPGSA